MEQKTQTLMLGTVGVAGLFLAGGTSVSANTAHKVSARDTVWGLSQKYGISIKSIEELNHIDSHSHLIYSGSTIQIPDKSAKSTDHAPAPVKTRPQLSKQSPASTSTYQVKAGDSLWSIAQKYQTSADQIRSLNDLGTTVITPGQALKVNGTLTKAPASTATQKPTASAPASTSKTPASGSTPSVQPAVPKETDTQKPAEASAPVKTAPEKTPDIQPSDAKSTPQSDTNQEHSKVEPKISANHTTYKVNAGDSLYTIADQYGVSVESLREANALQDSTLQVGQALTVNDPTKKVTAPADNAGQANNKPSPQTPAAPKQADGQQNSNGQAKTPTTPAGNTGKETTPTDTTTQPSQPKQPVSPTVPKQPATPPTAHGNGYSPAGNTYAWGQCTYYAKTRASWAGNYWGNGGVWDSTARSQGFTVNNQPTAGSLVVFHPGQSVGGQWTADGYAGHVAYVESVSGNVITISQGGMGFSSPDGPNIQTISNAGAYTYIHP